MAYVKESKIALWQKGDENMSISAIASGYGQGAAKYYQQIASGKKINSAADNAANLAISEKQKAAIAQAQGNSNNMKSYVNAANVADAAYSGMSDYVQDMNVQSIRAMNGTMSQSDLSAISAQMSQYSEGISSLANTTYNESSVVDEGAVSAATASFDLSSIDSAVASLNSARSANGAATNGYAYSSAVSDITAENLTASVSSMTDTDMAEAVTALKREQTLDTYKVELQKKMTEDEVNKNMALFA